MLGTEPSPLQEQKELLNTECSIKHPHLIFWESVSHQTWTSRLPSQRVPGILLFSSLPYLFVGDQNSDSHALYPVILKVFRVFFKSTGHLIIYLVMMGSQYWVIDMYHKIQHDFLSLLLHGIINTTDISPQPTSKISVLNLGLHKCQASILPISYSFRKAFIPPHTHTHFFSAMNPFCFLDSFLRICARKKEFVLE